MISGRAAASAAARRLSLLIIPASRWTRCESTVAAPREVGWAICLSRGTSTPAGSPKVVGATRDRSKARPHAYMPALAADRYALGASAVAARGCVLCSVAHKLQHGVLFITDIALPLIRCKCWGKLAKQSLPGSLCSCSHRVEAGGRHPPAVRGCPESPVGQQQQAAQGGNNAQGRGHS